MKKKFYEGLYFVHLSISSEIEIENSCHTSIPHIHECLNDLLGNGKTCSYHSDCSLVSCST